jgi:hypothetical protein
MGTGDSTMGNHRTSTIRICIILFVLLLLGSAQGCSAGTPPVSAPATSQNQGAQAVEEQDTPTLPPTDTTEPILTPTLVNTTDLPATPTRYVVQLYVPASSDDAETELKTQIETFEEQSYLRSDKQYEVQVEITFFDSIQLSEAGPIVYVNETPTIVDASSSVPTILALNRNELLSLAKQGYIWSADDEMRPYFIFLEDAVSGNIVSEKSEYDHFGYPWQRYGCSSDFLYLAIFHDTNDVSGDFANASYIANTLIWFLVDPSSQYFNLTRAQINPTLRIFYEGKYEGVNVVCSTEPPTDISTVEPPTETPLPLVTINLYVPDFSDTAKAELQKQIDAFEQLMYQQSEEQYQVQVNISYFKTLDLPDREKNVPPGIFEGNTPTVIALNNAELLYWAKNEYLEPVYSEGLHDSFLDDAIKNATWGETRYGLPWQRYSCSLNFLHLAILGNDAQYNIAQSLAAFLVQSENQNSNLTSLQIYPTLRSFYEKQIVSCQPVMELPLNSDLNEQMLLNAREQATYLLEKRNFQLQPGQAVGIDGTVNNTEPNVLKAVALPSAFTGQTYQEHELVGSISVIDPSLTPTGLWIQNKALMTTFKTPMGTYAIACRNLNDCLAIPSDGEALQIDPQSVERTEMPAPVITPTVAFEKGSVRVCYYIRKVRYCIKLF